MAVIRMELIQKQALEYLLEISSLMLEKAEAGDWDQVCKLQVARDEKISLFFSEERIIDSEDVSSGIKSIINSDKELTSLCKSKRKSLQDEIVKIKSGRSKIKAYLS